MSRLLELGENDSGGRVTCSGTTACYTGTGGDGAVVASLSLRCDLNFENGEWKMRVPSRYCRDYRVKEGAGAFLVFLAAFLGGIEIRVSN